MIHTIRKFLALLPAAILLLTAGCTSNADSNSRNASVRLLNVSIGYESLDLLSNNGDNDTDTQQFTAIGRGSLSSYAALKADSYTLKFRKSGTSGNLLQQDVTLAEDTHATYVIFGDTGLFSVAAIDEDVDAAESGFTKLQVLNATSLQAFDVYLTGADDSLQDVSASVSAVGAGSRSDVTSINSGSYRLRITGAGNKADLRLNVPTITLESKGVVTLVLTETGSGVLVNAVLLPQQGQPTTFDNTASARIRLLNVSEGYDSLDLFTNTGDGDADVQQAAAVARGTASAYATLKANTYTLKFRRPGTSGNLLLKNLTLVEDTNLTYVAYGAVGQFGVLPIDDNQEVPGSGYTNLQLANTTAHDSFDVYLSGSGDSLQDLSPTIAAVKPGTQTDTSKVPSGTYRLRVTRAGDKSDLRLDAPAVSLDSRGVASLILTDTPSGVLVNAVLLPQQGQPTSYDNGTARIRGAAGLSTGSAVTVTVGGVDLLTRRSARSVIGETYGARTAGTLPVTVAVDNVVVASGTVAVQAGRDYTLLVWDAGGATQMTLVTDDNHVSTTSRATIRLLNGMSGAATPLTLALDYSPVAEYVELGSASSPVEVNSGADRRLDVYNAQTLATLLTRDAVTLEASGVYTFFVAGGGGAAMVGTLRKDR